MIGRLEKLIQPIVLAMIFIIFVNVIVGVAFRYIFNRPLSFTFDLATLLFAWVSFLGLLGAAREKALIGVDFFTNYLKPTVAYYVAILTNVLLIIISVAMIYLGLLITIETNMELGGLRISQKWLYASVPVGFSLYLIFLIGDLINIFRGSNKSTTEEGTKTWE